MKLADIIRIGIIISIIFFVVGFLVGQLSIKNPSGLEGHNRPAQSILDHPTEFTSPDKNKKLILKGNVGGANVYVVTENNVESKILYVSAPRNIRWSPDSSKVSITSHISNEEQVHIINAKTGGYVVAEGHNQFVNSQKNPKEYTHVYSRLLSWLDSDSLIIKVSGYPDFSDHTPEPHYYLIDASNGKVVKRIK